MQSQGVHCNTLVDMVESNDGKITATESKPVKSKFK